MPTISLDFETFYSKGYGIQECGLYGYTHHEKFDPYMISVADGSESWAGEPRDFNWNALDGATIVSHNAAFDRTVYEAMVEQGLAPKVNYKDWVCSANLSAYICNRRSLADACKYLLGIDVSKEMRNYMRGKTWSQAQEDGDAADKLLEYARLDAVYCLDIWNKFSPQWPDHEKALSALTINQGTRGIQLDVKKLDTYIAHAQEAMLAIEADIPWLETDNDAKPTSSKAIAEQCRKNGMPCPPIKSHEDGEEKFAWWEETYGPKYPWVAAVSNWRSMNKFLGSLERMKAWMRPDGTMPFSLKYFGAHTGRWAGDAGFNMQNLRKDPILLDRKTMRLADSSSKRPLALDIRSLIIPRPGKKLFIADSSQIEPRVLAWLTGNIELMDKIREGMSVYEVHARQSLGWEGGSLKFAKKASEKLLYKRSKAEVLALGYGCGAEKYVAAAWAMAKYKVDPEDAVREVQQFRENNPQIVGLWRDLDEKFKQSLNSDFIIGLPSGRELRYEKVGCELRRYKDKEGKPKTKWAYTANVGGRRRIFYGGMLTENLVQAVARDVFAVQMLDVESQAGAATLFSAHDEVVGELDMDVDLCVVEKCLSKCPDFLEGCPIACEAEIAKHYKK